MRDIGAKYRIQPADPKTVHLLSAIGVTAAAIFPPEDISPELRSEGLSVSTFEEAEREGRLWTAVSTADDQPVGFALATIVDDNAHLFEVDVLPEHGRRGLGSALVTTVASWAREQGYPFVTLTTFRHLPWNAPFYRRLGFVEIDDDALTPGLTGHLEQEERNGLDRSKRVAMRLAT